MKREAHQLEGKNHPTSERSLNSIAHPYAAPSHRMQGTRAPASANRSLVPGLVSFGLRYHP
jgi:hypothetical protein